MRWMAASEFRSREHRKAFDDRLLVVLFAVEDRPFSFGDDLFAGRALPSPAAFTCETELTQVSGVTRL